MTSPQMLDAIYGLKIDANRKFQDDDEVQGLLAILGTFAKECKEGTTNKPSNDSENLFAAQSRLQESTQHSTFQVPFLDSERRKTSASDTKAMSLRWDKSDCDEVCAALKNIKENCTFFPRYGCVLCREALTIGMVQVKLLALDQWQVCLAPTGRSAFAVSGAILVCCTIDEENIPTLLTGVQSLLLDAQKLSGNKRSAGHNEQGHQKTPAFIEALVKESYNKIIDPDAAQVPTAGGFTDVGYHTGGEPRDTSWALVRTAMKHLLSSEILYEKVILTFDVWNLQKLLSDPNVQVDCAFHIMDQAIGKAISLANRTYDVSEFERQFAEMRHLLEEYRLNCCHHHGRQFQLDQSKLEKDFRVSNRLDPQIQVPQDLEDLLHLSRQHGSINNQTNHSLGCSLCISANEADFNGLDRWLSDASGSRTSTEALLLILTSVEQLFFRFAMTLMDSYTILSESDVCGPLIRTLERYRLTLQTFLKQDESRSILYVQLRSTESLLVWIGCCLVHKCATVKYQSIKDYRIALNWRDLKHFVLADRVALDALLNVAAYIRKWEPLKNPLFSLRNQAPTFAFAEDIAKTDDRICSQWTQEEQLAQARSKERWSQVQRKKNQAAEKRKEMEAFREAVIKPLEADFNAKLAMYEACTTLESRRMWQSSKDKSKNELLEKRRALATKQNELDEILKAPPPVFNPLPKDRDSGLKVLFFLMMPPQLSSYSRMILMAQQMLHPRNPWKAISNSPTSEQILPKGHDVKQSWAEVYNLLTKKTMHRSGFEARDGAVFLDGVKWPDTVGGDKVDDLNDESDGVWFPPLTVRLTMAWRGGGFELDSMGGKTLDPFSLNEEVTKSFYTEVFTEEGFENLQWAIQTPAQGLCASSCDRGNLPFSKQNQKPTLLSKQGFLEFGSLRSYPNQQHRKLVTALAARSFPLAVRSVLTLIRQALFQVGELSDEERPKLEWHRDFFSFDGKVTLLRELGAYADSLEQCPSDFAVMEILGELASYVVQHDESDVFSSRAVARKYIDMVFKWTSGIGSCIKNPHSNLTCEVLLELRAKSCLITAIGLSCFGLLPVESEEDAERLCRLVLQYENDFSFASNSTLLSNMTGHRVRCQQVMPRRMDEMITFASRVLSSAVSTIVGRDNVPEDLIWVRKTAGHSTDSLSTCFEAETTDKKQSFCVNLLNGRLLINGAPLQRLPHYIRETEMYIRSFGKRDFEVLSKRISSECTLYQTVSIFEGCVYEFSLFRGSLYVYEVEIETETKLLLLDKVHLCCTQDLPFPAILRESYSHWYSKERNVVLFRPLCFLQRTIDYLVKVPESSCQKTVHARCFQVPERYREQPMTFLSDRTSYFNRLVILRECNIRRVLSKIEKDLYVHSLETASQSMLDQDITIADGDPETPDRLNDSHELVFELPRFSLEFRLSRNSSGFLQLKSQKHRGYRFAEKQYLDDTMASFKDYLILERIGADPSEVAEILIVPDGDIDVSESEKDHNRFNNIRVTGHEDAVFSSKGFVEKCQYFTYKVHPRFKTFVARSVVARLHLAAILAASGCCLQDSRLGMTGGEAAIVAVRQCFMNRPLSTIEGHKLKLVMKFALDEPALHIICVDLDRSCSQVSFLFENCDKAASVACDSDMMSAYLSGNRQTNFRSQLTPCESERMFGRLPKKTMPDLADHSSFKFLETEIQWDSYKQCVENVESELDKMIHDSNYFVNGSVKQLASYPLDAATEDVCHLSDLSENIHQELRSSWTQSQAHGQQSKIKSNTNQLEKTLHRLSELVSNKRKSMWSDLVMAIDVAKAHSTQFRLMMLVNRTPRFTLTDVMRVALDYTVTKHFNPFLSAKALHSFRQAAMTFLMLCVLEDRLERLKFLSCSDSSSRFISELQNKRTWMAFEHSYWLVFEAESRLQIRPDQFQLVDHLIRSPGTIMQLNMGLGKTRVILPMLILSFAAASSRKHLTRIHVLSPLLKETIDYFRQHLTASVLLLPVFEQPFQRDTEISKGYVGRLEECARMCCKMGGCQIVTPEYRQSAELMSQMHCKKPGLLKELSVVLQNLDCTNIFDECDLVLSHRKKLIYTLGTPEALSDGPLRWALAAHLLNLLSSDADVDNLLHDSKSGLFVLESADRSVGKQLGNFRRIRLIATETCEHRAWRERLRRTLLKAFINDPPYEMSWIEPWFQHLSQKSQDVVITAVIGCASSLKTLLSEVKLPSDIGYNDTCDPWSCLLALRALLGCGILEHCLEQRNRVSFGLPAPKTRSKRLAVPYVAADVPSESAEFGHPDVAIALTLLAYCYEGLSREQLNEAIVCLKQQGHSAQQHCYALWLASEAEVPAAIDKVEKIDLTNLAQQDLLLSTFGSKVVPIAFFLSFCVFPKDTVQYSQQLESSAWHLADSKGNQHGHNSVHHDHLQEGLQGHSALGSSVGFSGTNDNHLLMPSQVRQKTLPFLEATNGKMLADLMNNTAGCTTLYPDQALPTWKALLRRVVASGFHALVDAGSLLAGVKNIDGANFVLDEIDTSKGNLHSWMEGVVYFDSDLLEWSVLERGTRQRISLNCSPIHEADCFVIFDDARTRGADMKLKERARAALTLGTKMTKDKLIQGAGRMRQLDNGQSLELIGTEEVQQAILRGKSSLEYTVVDVLKWVVRNTVDSLASGIADWAGQGFYFLATQKELSQAVVNEDFTLSAMYESAHAPQQLSLAVREALQRHLKQIGMDHDMADLLLKTDKRRSSFISSCQPIIALSDRWGHNIEIVSSQVDSQCEREVQAEVEAHHELTKELPRMDPVCEIGWDYSKVSSAQRLEDLAVYVGAVPLGDEISRLLPFSRLRRINWMPAQIFCTRQFFNTVQRSSAMEPRPVDALLLFAQSDHVLLLSDREADGVLGVLSSNTAAGISAGAATSGISAGCALVNLSRIRNLREILANPRLLQAASNNAVAIRHCLRSDFHAVVASCLLFNGECIYSDTRLLEALARVVLTNAEARAAALEIVNLRGKLAIYPYSDLDKVVRAGALDS